MYLSGCVGCIPMPSTVPFWTQIHHGQNEVLKKSSAEVSEFLNRTLLPAGFSSRTVNLRNSPPPSGLANLRALCATDMEVFISRGLQKTVDSTHNKQLKFGINRILSDDFGKEKLEKENRQVFCHSSATRFSKSSESCATADCSSLSHLYSSISAVHSIHPSLYHYNSGGDILPGPYSILSTETHNPNQPKRKRSWSRAVFSNLQRKGLEKRFEVQKYVTKPDRRQLAAMLGLTDAQVKVWFQNRRMKWRHAQQQKEKGEQTEGDEKPGDMMDSDEEDINVTEDISEEEWEDGEKVIDEDAQEDVATVDGECKAATPGSEALCT